MAEPTKEPETIIPNYKFTTAQQTKFTYKPDTKFFIVDRFYDKGSSQNFYVGRTFSEKGLSNSFVKVAESELEDACETVKNA